jgi:hypothetical protein
LVEQHILKHVCANIGVRWRIAQNAHCLPIDFRCSKRPLCLRCAKAKTYNFCFALGCTNTRQSGFVSNMNPNELAAAERFSRNAQVEPLFGSSDGAVADVLALGDKYRKKRSELTPQDIQAILKAHNDLRARYGVAPLQWSEQLASHAKQWADTCYWGHWKAQRTKNALGADYFPPPQQMGENLSVWRDPGSTLLGGQYGTKLWLDEEKDFDCNTGQCIPGRMCGHWTQMIWDDTKRVGCALRTCEDGMDERSWPSQTIGVPGVQYLVCLYDPPGNFTGERPFPIEQCSQPGLNGNSSEQPDIRVGRTFSPEPASPRPAEPRPRASPPTPQRPSVVPRTTPGAGMVAQNENMSSVPAFFAGMGRQDRVSGAPRRPTPFVPAGFQFVDRDSQVPATEPVANEPVAPPIVQNNANNENNAIQGNADNVVNQMNGNDTELPPPAPMPAMTSEPPKSDSAKIAWTAGGALAASAALGAALGAGFYFLNKSDDRKNR